MRSINGIKIDGMACNIKQPFKKKSHFPFKKKKEGFLLTDKEGIILLKTHTSPTIIQTVYLRPCRFNYHP